MSNDFDYKLKASETRAEYVARIKELWGYGESQEILKDNDAELKAARFIAEHDLVFKGIYPEDDSILPVRLVKSGEPFVDKTGKTVSPVAPIASCEGCGKEPAPYSDLRGARGRIYACSMKDGELFCPNS